VPALAEEFLFRYALVPAISPDWRGALISGLVFGALHVNGGRNAAFAVWASAVGTAYGALYLHTGSLAACVAAHALANVLSASLWLGTYQSSNG
jgi:membrane protease YdiL (CAAX protease family)